MAMSAPFFSSASISLTEETDFFPKEALTVPRPDRMTLAMNSPSPWRDTSTFARFLHAQKAWRAASLPEAGDHVLPLLR